MLLLPEIHLNRFEVKNEGGIEMVYGWIDRRKTEVDAVWGLFIDLNQ